MWAKRLISPGSGSWRAYPKLIYEKIAGIYSFKSSLDIKKNSFNLPEFYWQILKSWIQFRDIHKPINSCLDIRREILWNNEKIKIKNKTINWSLWKNHNIWIIHDIIDEHGKFLTATQINERYGINCNFLMYNSLKDAIPINWRKKLKEQTIQRTAINVNEVTIININEKQIPLQNITNKLVYWTHVEQKQIPPIIKAKWTTEFNINNAEWKQIFLISKIIKDTKIRVLQYKILYNLIPCKLYLFRINKSNTYICDKCNETDNVTHYFYSCNVTIRFWKTFEQWWNNMMNDKIKISKKLVMAGDLNKKPNEILNACLLIAKWYIYTENLDEKEPFFYKFLCHLKFKINTEKIIYLRNNIILKYLNFWAQIEEHLT
jgi:hypothetical protein